MAQVKVILEVGNYSTEHGYIKGWETFQFKNDTRHRLWTLWTRNLDGINEGDTIEVTGDIATKAATYVPKNATEPKTIVEHSLNNVSIINKGKTKITQVRNATDILTQIQPQDDIDLPF